MDDQEQPRTPEAPASAPPEPAPERLEKAAREAVTGSASMQAQPINMAPAVPTEIPQAAIGTPSPQASATDPAGAAGGDGDEQ